MYPQHNKKILNQYTMKIKINISDHEKKKWVNKLWHDYTTEWQ
jgi:hypothetical protein